MTTQHSESLPVPEDTFELRLAIARFHHGNISAREAAMLVGVSGQAWRDWEAGKSNGARKPAMLAYIAQQLDVDPDWLLNGGPLRRPTDDDSGSRASVPAAVGQGVPSRPLTGG